MEIEVGTYPQPRHAISVDGKPVGDGIAIENAYAGTMARAYVCAPVELRGYEGRRGLLIFVPENQDFRP